MGVVFLAEDEKLGRKAALKILPPAMAKDEELEARFRREAALASKLEHPGIVRIYGVGEALGTHYFAMQYVKGENLRNWKGDLREASRIVKAVAEALAYAHREGVLHRDIKPENIMLRSADASPLIADFGLAREENMQTLTRTGQIVGTPAYMSPEQAEGNREGMDGRTDQYSLGATLYEMITGKRVFDAHDARSLMFKVMLEEPNPARRVKPEIPRDLETVVMKSLEKDPARRYPSCAALAEDLGRFLAGEPVAAKPVGPVQRLLRRAGKHKILVGAFLVAFAALVLGVYFTLAAVAQGREAREEKVLKYEEAMRRGMDLFGRNEYEKASEAFVEALSVRGDDARAEAWKARARASFLVDRGRRALDKRAYDQALADLLRARDLLPGHPDLPDLLRKARRIGFLAIEVDRDFGGKLEGADLLPGEPGGDGTASAVSPPFGEIELADGVYRVRVRASDFYPAICPVRVKAGQTSTLRLPAVPLSAVPSGMVFVAGGSFLSGDEQLAVKEEDLGPFFIDEREVSVSKYRAFVEAASDPDESAWRTPEGWMDGESGTEEDELPVTGVTWEQAYEYARWAGKHLPSPLEWEKAARGIDGRPFPWGRSFDASRCNSPYSKEGRPQPVSSHPEGRSPYGALNMAGNVAEWTAGSPAREGAPYGDGRVRIMGGSFAETGPDALKTYRYRLENRKASPSDVGFRCARFFRSRESLRESIPFGAPAEVSVAQEWRVEGDAEVVGFVRILVRNPREEPLAVWKFNLLYFTRVKRILSQEGRELVFRETSRHVVLGRNFEVELAPPLPTGESTALTLEGRSAYMGRPAFLRDADRFTIRHVEMLRKGDRAHIRLVLPADANLEIRDPPPRDQRLTDRGWELFWDLEPEDAAKPVPLPDGREGFPVALRIEYRREGVDLRFREQDAFFAERERFEVGKRKFDPEVEADKFARDYGNKQGITRAMIQISFEMQKKQIAFVETSFEFRAAEFLGPWAVSTETMTMKVWNHEGKITADSEPMLMQCVCVREEGRWKHLFEDFAPRFEAGVIDEEKHTYTNKRYRCFLEPLPRWRLTLREAAEGFAVVMVREDRDDLMAVFGGAPLPKKVDASGVFDRQMETLKEFLGDQMEMRIFDSTLSGVPARASEVFLKADRDGRQLFSFQRRRLALKNRCLYSFTEIINGFSREEVERKRAEFEDLFREVGDAVVIE